MKAVRAGTRTYRKIGANLEKGRSLRDSMFSVRAAQTRMNTKDALDRYERLRHDVRVELVAIGLEEGLSIGEVAQLFGFSRQLAQRYAREAAESTTRE